MQGGGIGIFLKYSHLELHGNIGGRRGENGGAKAEIGDAAGKNGFAIPTGMKSGHGIPVIMPYGAGFAKGQVRGFRAAHSGGQFLTTVAYGTSLCIGVGCRFAYTGAQVVAGF